MTCWFIQRERIKISNLQFRQTVTSAKKNANIEIYKCKEWRWTVRLRITGTKWDENGPGIDLVASGRSKGLEADRQTSMTHYI